METATKHPVEQILKDHFCVPKGEIRENMQGIYNDGDYIVATDGKILVEISLKEYPELNGIGQQIQGFPNWKAVMPKPEEQKFRKELPLSDIVTDLTKERDAEKVTCTNCSGEGLTEHQCNCGFCDESLQECPKCEGTGVYKDPQTEYRLYVRIKETPFRASYLNTILDLFKFFDIEKVTLGRRSSNSALVIQAKGIRALCAYFFMNREDAPENFEITKTINI